MSRDNNKTADAGVMDCDKKKVKKSYFKQVTVTKKENVMQKRKAENTNRATKLWVDLFKEFLHENNDPELDLIDTEDYPRRLKISMFQFDLSVKLQTKKKISLKVVKKRIMTVMMRTVCTLIQL